MGDKHRVRFEPVGIEIEVDEDQTILRAASEQGVQLMHGCKEGQCAACKSFVLEGEMDDIELDRYSTFALPDMEREEGQTLLCRAHAYDDLVIELLNYDEEIIRSGLPLRKGTVEVLANDAGHPRHAPPGGQADRRRGHQVLPRPVHGLHRPRHRRGPVVLDGEHPEPRGRVRVRHQDLPRRGCSRSSWSTRCRSATDSRSRRRSGPAPSARAGRRTSSSSAAVPAWLRCWACCAPSPRRTATARRASTTAPARRTTCASRRRLRALEEKIPGFKYVPALSEPRR